MKKDIKKLQETFAQLQKEYRAKANGTVNSTEEIQDQMYYMMDRVAYMIDNVHQRISYLEQDFSSFAYNHQKNHLPPLTPSGMEKLLSAAGMSEDFQIQRPTIYMSNAKKKEFTVDMMPPKNA